MATAYRQFSLPGSIRTPLRLLLPGVLGVTAMALSAAPGAGQFAGGEPSQLVSAHNTVREDVEPVAMPPLPSQTWSGALATTAQAHATLCLYQHSGTPTVGENLYASTGDPNLRPTPVDIVTAWASEMANYDYPSNTCDPGKVCGHYRQIVWRAATQLGCGIQLCTPATSPFDPPFDTFNWYLVVCQYSSGQTSARPYLCDYDGNGSTTHVCTSTFFADGFEETQALPGNWAAKAP